MTSSNRREFLTQAAALTAASGLPVPALAQAVHGELRPRPS